MKKRSLSMRALIWAGALLASAVLLGFLAWVANVWTDYQWFVSMGQQVVFQTAFLSKAVVWSGFTLAGFAVLYASARAAWLVISTKPRYPRLTATACLLLAGALASLLSRDWMAFRLAAAQPSFGVKDLQFGVDVGFFVFTLPAMELIYKWLNGLTIVAMVTVAAIAASGQMRVAGTIPARWWKLKKVLLSLAGVLMIAISLNFWISVWRISYSPAGQIFGASYSDIAAALPANWIMLVLSLVFAAVLFIMASRREWKAVAVASVVWAAAGVLLIVVWPTVVQDYVATPNEATIEEDYRARNITMTRAAFDLTSVDGVQYPGVESVPPAAAADAARVLGDATVWTPSSVAQAFNQLQTIRPYYRLSSIEFDRYRIDGELRQVLVAARQIDPSGLPANARTWVNTHLVYTHGYGLAMSSASQTTTQGFPTFFVGDVPPGIYPAAQEADGLRIDEPRVYFGPDMTGYAIVNTGVDEFDYPMAEKNAKTRYTGSGAPIGSFPSRLAWATRLVSDQLMFSSYIRPDSQILLHRGIEERASKLAPWLSYDKNPYAAVVDGRIVWILDAYTSSDHYPNSQPLADGTNYLRNSVKVVVDAHSGETRFYAVGDDPIRDAWAAIFPSIITPEEELPAEVAEHVRAPRRLFSAQAEVYRAYHMTEPTDFYNREDLWDIPKETDGEQIEPAYLMLDLPDASGRPTGKAMYLLQPFSLSNRDNLVGWMATACDPGSYGERTVYLLPKARVVLGPRNIGARINQDPRISQQLTLWSQPGNSVLFGSMLVIPVENSVAYLQPVFLQAQDNAITQLVSVIAVNGDRVDFAPTLPEALSRSFGAADDPVIGSTAGGQ